MMQITTDTLCGMILAVRRRELRVGQKRMALALVMTQPTLSRYENGQYGFSVGQLAAACELLDMTLEEVWTVYRHAKQALAAKDIQVVLWKEYMCDVDRMTVHSAVTNALRACGIVVPDPATKCDETE